MRFCLMFLLGAVVVLTLGARAGSAQEANAPSGAPNAAAGSALVVGNAAYGSGGLAGFENAKGFASELSRLGFAVTAESDLRQSAMRRAIDSFAGAIKPGSAALFFFSGYGIEAKGSTYLIPVDADIWTETDVRSQGIDVGSILRTMEKAGASVKILILDASRRNPFERRFRSLSAGLGDIDLPPRTLLLSASEPGKVVAAAAGDGVFVGELLKELRSPELNMEAVFNQTRLGVSRATNNQQSPLVKSTLDAAFFLNSPAAAAAQQGPGDGPEASGAEIGLPPDAKPRTVFRDCAACPDLVIAPAGEFDMGSDDFETERPVHSVAIAKPFAIGRAEVTAAQWQACVADGGCAGWRPNGGQGRGDVPVSEVSWSDARRFLDWLSRKTGHAYRLPSEAEWEYAARGGARTRYCWGDEPGAGHANCRGCGGPGQATPAGSYPANGFGLLDAAGNVAEWVEDCWTESYAGAPRDGAVAQDGPCRQRVVRGGSFDAGTRYVRSASRFLYDAELRYYTNGFRVLRDLP